jgi:hypothetical protein
MTKSRERTTIWGDKIVEYFDDAGKKTGESQEREGVLGKYIEYSDTSGHKTGESQEREGVLGKYIEYTDTSGHKTGESQEREGVLGKYIEYTDTSGHKTGESRVREGVLGPYVEHTGYGTGPRREAPGTGPSQAADPRGASDSSSGAHGGTDWSDGGEHGPASPSRVGPGIGVGKLALFALLAVTLALLAAVLRHAGETSRAGNSQSPIVAAPLPDSPTARLEGIAYSYSKEQWAWTEQTYGSQYPEVRRLGFFNWLHWGAGVSWKGSHTITQDSLSLSIRDLTLPAGIERDNASSFHMLDQWSDVGVGYYVELRRATFDDLALSKHILFFRTFVGDTPPALIQTALSLHPVSLATASPRFAGQWVGVYKNKTDETPFVMRITQDGSTLSGSAMDYGAQKRRSSIFGYVVGTSVTLLKRYADTPYAASLVSREGTPNQMAGTWRLGNLQGHWNATLEGAIDGAVDDLPVTLPALSRRSTTAAVFPDGEGHGSSEPASGSVHSNAEVSDSPLPDGSNQATDARLLLRFRFSLRTGRVMAWLDYAEIFQREFSFDEDSSERLVESGALPVAAGRHHLGLLILGVTPPSNAYTKLDYTAGPGEMKTITARLVWQGLRQKLAIGVDH